MANLISERSDDLLPLKPTPETRSQWDERAILDCTNWLSFHRVWGQLSQEVTFSLFGKEGEQLGAIKLLERGTLLIDNVQLLSHSDRDRLSDYLKTGTLTPNSGAGKQMKEKEFSPSQSLWVRLILASSSKISLPDIEAHQIKLFSLPQRKQDIPDFAQYFLEKFCRERGRSLLELSQADLRRLLGYDYPGNLAELEGILKRAVVQTPAGQITIPEQVLWSVTSKKNAFRIDLSLYDSRRMAEKSFSLDLAASIAALANQMAE